MDVEREGGIRTSAGDMGAGENAEADAEAEAGVEMVADVGGGSLATFVICGAMTGEREGVWPGWGDDAVEDRVGVGTAMDAGAPVETAPVSSETYLSATAFPEKNSPEVRHGSMEGAGGKMSDWNESDWRRGVCQLPWWRIDGGLTFRGTMNAIGSMAFEVSLYARAISQSDVLTARRGTKHIPRCGSLDLCSSNG